MWYRWFDADEKIGVMYSALTPRSARYGSRSVIPRRSPPLNPWRVGGVSQGSSGPGFGTRTDAAKRSGKIW